LNHVRALHDPQSKPQDAPEVDAFLGYPSLANHTVDQLSKHCNQPQGDIAKSVVFNMSSPYEFDVP